MKDFLVLVEASNPENKKFLMFSPFFVVMFAFINSVAGSDPDFNTKLN
jgi:hypothetical protein